VAAYSSTVRPDWVILGVQYSNMVQIYASNVLTTADLRNLSMLYGGTQFEMCVTAHQLIVVEGATYEEALRTLFAQWTPTKAPRAEINPHNNQRGIAAPPKELPR